METIEYRALQIGVGQLKIVGLRRCVFESKGARDSFEQCGDFTVKTDRKSVV